MTYLGCIKSSLGDQSPGYPSWWTWINLHIQNTRRSGQTKGVTGRQAIATGSDSSSMLDTSELQLDPEGCFPDFFTLWTQLKKIGPGSNVGYPSISHKGWLVHPNKPWTCAAEFRPSLYGRRSSATSAQCIWKAGDTRRPGPLCRAARAQGWGLDSQSYCLGCLGGETWRNRFICIHIMYDVHILYLIINILSMHMYGLFTVNRLYQKWDQTDEIPAPLMWKFFLQHFDFFGFTFHTVA